jgi:hypothetical protein
MFSFLSLLQSLTILYPHQGLSSLTSNVSKWTLFAKDNVVKIGSKAAEKATELTKTVNEKVKEGNLLTSMQTGVAKVGASTTKAWSDLWNANSKSEYNSIPSSQSTYGSESNSYAYQTSRDNDNEFNTSSSYSKLSDSNNKKNKQDDWNNWQDDSTWTGGNESKAKSQQKSTSNNNKPNLIDFDSPKVDDNWAEDDDNWEPIEPVKPKSKK